MVEGSQYNNKKMSDTGRFWVVDHKTGRRFCVEPISERDQQVNTKEWDVGGAESVDGGAIRREDSVITEENGFEEIVEIQGSIMSEIEKRLKKGDRL